MIRIRRNHAINRLARHVAALSLFVWLLAPALAHPDIVARRGGQADGPENTLATFGISIDANADWLEIDVWLTADGELVCFHDKTLDRTTDGTGAVYEKTLAELKLLDAGSWFSEGFAGERIPTFREAIELIKGQARILLDVKSAAGPPEDAGKYLPKILEVLDDEGFPLEDIIGWTKGPGPALEWSSALPDAGVLYDVPDSLGFEEEDIWLRATQNDLGLMYGFYKVDADHIDLVHAYGLRAWVINTPSTLYQTAFDMGADGLLVQDPVGLAEALPQSVPACSDGIDNDNDGNKDYPQDEGCYGPGDDAESSACSDGIDNDGDGNTDYPDDPGCFSRFYDSEEPACDDGVDNNGDGEVDYPDDAGCFASFDRREGVSCNDGIDNDGDGLVDYPADSGCESPNDVDECASDDCDGPCGLCPVGEFCDQGTCAICILDCGGKDCGDDGCGGSCGTCDSGFACDALNSLCCTPDTDLDSVCDVDDCAPDDNGSYQVPDEVLNVRMTSKTGIQWDSLAPQAGTLTAYHVLRGEVADLPVGGPSESCLSSVLIVANATDLSNPPVGTAFYYVIRGANTCGTGTLGYDSFAAERLSSSCP